MKALDHFAEPRAPHGGLMAEGALNLLGRPDLDPLVVFAREAVQNSWDARQGRGQVSVEVEIRSLEVEERSLLRNKLFQSLPPSGLSGDGLGRTMTDIAEVLASSTIRVLSFTDRGTSGLGGPVHADEESLPSEVTDFVDLVFNIGQRPDKSMGGGTYGFGKTISYLISRCRTVLIHTSALFRGVVQQRLIVQSIGVQYSYGGKNFTGRHWWGELSGRGIGPAVGDTARELAAQLGLPQFDDQSCGTTIVVLEPDFGERTDLQAGHFIADAVAWNFWPKMVGEAGRPASMGFSVQVNGTNVPIPQPSATHGLRDFAKLLTAVRDCDSGRLKPDQLPMTHVHEVWCQKPRVLLGWLALQAAPRSSQIHHVETAENESKESAKPATLLGAVHHIALMRRAELVVQYLSGPPLADGALEWFGVFRASEDTDRAFAAAEPPTHDDWRPALVSNKSERRFVNVALREIKSFADKAFTSAKPRRDDSPRASAATIAEALGQLLSPTPGTGASKPSKKSGERKASSGGARRVKFEVLNEYLSPHRDDTCVTLNVEFAIHGALGHRQLVAVRASAAAADGTVAETEAPFNSPVPAVEGIESEGRVVEGGRVDLDSSPSIRHTALIRQPRGVATLVEITEAEEPAR